MPTILLADDDQAICTVLSHGLRRQGFAPLVAHTTRQLMIWVEEGKGDAVITDVVMPDANGLDLLPHIKQLRPNLPVIVISAQNSLMTAVKANALGAYEYFPKPFDLEALLRCIEKSVRPPVAHEGGDAQAEAATAAALGADGLLIGRSHAMQLVYLRIAKLVALELTVLVTGESGTGKEMVARALHQLGPRREGPFVALNMAAIPEALIESELFGHEKGAFTGAIARKPGAFEQAEGGVLFLDEIGDMPLDAQTRLLRVLQQGEYSAVGSVRPRPVQARVIAASNLDLSEAVAAGAFREDLYYRLNVVPIHLPPLRDRSEDIKELAEFFLQKAHHKGLARKYIAPEAMQALTRHTWPGNVRELEHLLYRLAALHSDAIIDAGAVRQALASLVPGKEKPEAFIADGSLPEAVRAHIASYFQAHGDSLPPEGMYDRLLPLFEKPLIEATLQALQGNQFQAAKLLGINRNTLRKKIQAYGLKRGA